tara:strand:+ start:3012 stop:3821 length:810 start_codon:yes stop_codon:yes gene_type:complete
MNSDKKLVGKVALVTGGSKGIGASIVKKLAQEGARVYFCARESKSFYELEKQSKQKGFIVKGIIADVTKINEIKRIFLIIKKDIGILDILINNVGGAIRYGGFFDLEDKDWINTFEFNVLPVVRFVKEATPLLKKSNLKRIVNISSIVSIQPGFYNPHYSLTKSAIVNLTKHLSKIFAKDKILVNVVCPGPVHSSAWDENINNLSKIKNSSFNKEWEIMENEESKKIPLGRVGEPEDISGIVNFLCSKDSSWITGSVFHVNGGKLSTMY